jgi:hypothetical protein
LAVTEVVDPQALPDESEFLSVRRGGVGHRFAEEEAHIVLPIPTSMRNTWERAG